MALHRPINYKKDQSLPQKPIGVIFLWGNVRRLLTYCLFTLDYWDVTPLLVPAWQPLV